MYFKNIIVCCFLWGTGRSYIPEKSTLNTGLLLRYQSELELSVTAEKSARNISKFALQELFKCSVDIVADSRLKALGLKDNTLADYREDIEKDECVSKVVPDMEQGHTIYLESQKPCCDLAAGDAIRSRKRFQQFLKQVRKWRISFRHMRSSCRQDYPEDYEEFAECFTAKIEPEHYDYVILRLIPVLEQFENDFVQHIERVTTQLRQCIQDSYSEFQEAVRTIVENITLCREEKAMMIETIATPSPGRLMEMLKCAKIH